MRHGATAHARSRFLALQFLVPSRHLVCILGPKSAKILDSIEPGSQLIFLSSFVKTKKPRQSPHRRPGLRKLHLSAETSAWEGSSWGLEFRFRSSAEALSLGGAVVEAHMRRTQDPNLEVLLILLLW